MNGQRGFVLLIGLLLGTVILAIVAASYTNYFRQSLDRIPSIGSPGQTDQQLVGRKAVVFEMEDIETGEVKSGSLGIVPHVAFDYRMSLVDTDYETYAAILVENISEEVYRTEILGKGESASVGGIQLTITDFIASP